MDRSRQLAYQSLQRVLGMLIMFVSFTMLPPVLVSLIYRDGSHLVFIESFFLTFLVGALTYWPVRRVQRDLRPRDGFIIATGAWLVLSLASAVPLLLSKYPEMSLTDAVFEAFSGLTTTGATVLTGIDFLPPGVLYFRQQLQWLGGMGIVVLAVAVLPFLRVGGMQLFRAEMPGPMKDAKITPRITDAAKTLWYLYLTLTLTCAFAYWLAGMTAFDAICHAFSTVAIGGFSTHDASIGYYDSILVEWVAIVFMFLAGINFATHFLAWRRASTGPYLQDPELKSYAIWLAVIAVVVTLGLWFSDRADFGNSLRLAAFQTVSVLTTTGFTTDTFHTWPGVLPVLLIVGSFVGACAGSTGGGIKMIRVLLVYRHWMRELTKLVHPSAQTTVKIARRRAPEQVIASVTAFFALYIASFVLGGLAVAATGVDWITAFSAAAACLNNLGPALGQAGAHYGDLPDVAKWILSFLMLLGRLEVFTLIVLLTPLYWRD